ncbi:hypothetical protein [Leptolyngbya sp. FACHB-17]|uniref:mechanosensitive ion channel family protein n=1 Tax=unclassified Leptolyngbya TaxID=2650499 RepID=UPI0016808352|nr:hypothetical protein [Leptolyngbya sp. FACHB-17]
MVQGFLALLPNLILAVIVFVVFCSIGRTVKRTVRRATGDRRRARNLGLALGRLAQGIIILIGLFVTWSIVIPTLKASDLVQPCIHIP